MLVPLMTTWLDLKNNKHLQKLVSYIQALLLENQILLYANNKVADQRSLINDFFCLLVGMYNI